MFEFQVAEGVAAYYRALDLNRSPSTAHDWLALGLESQGEFHDAYDHVQRARELDPLAPIIEENEAWCLYLWRRLDDSITVYRKLVGRVRDYPLGYHGLALNYLALERPEEAVGQCEQACRLWGDCPFILGTLGMANARSGRRDKAHAILDKLESLSRHIFVPSYENALVYAGLDRNSDALEQLERAYEERNGSVLYLNVNPIVDSLRREPRFEHLVRKLARHGI